VITACLWQSDPTLSVLAAAWSSVSESPVYRKF